MRLIVSLLTAAGLLWLTSLAGAAVPLGVQDDARPQAAIDAGRSIGARWTRIITVPGDSTAARRIRVAHAAGLSVILTIGGTGTSVPIPTSVALRHAIDVLPHVERLTVVNEPDLTGMTACQYRRVWMTVRRSVGRRLLWGDFSPHAPLTFTRRARHCGHLPATLDFALHPYQGSDPLHAGVDEGSIGNLGRLRRGLGGHVRFWLTEFAYIYHGPRSFEVTDEQAAMMWPRALLAAQRAHAAVLMLYTASGPTWDSRPRPLAWNVLTGRTAPTLVALPTAEPGDYVG